MKIMEILSEAPLPPEWDKQVYTPNTSYKKRIEYAVARAQKLGKGSSRTVVEIPYQGRQTVLKVAHNGKGMAQNEAEAGILDDWYVKQSGLVIPIIDYDEDHSQPVWLHTEKAEKVNAKQLCQLLRTNDLSTLIRYANMMVGKIRYEQTYMDRVIQTITELYGEDGAEIFSEYAGSLGDLATNNDVDLRDFNTHKNWGVYKGEPVVIDIGFTKDVAAQYYSEEIDESELTELFDNPLPFEWTTKLPNDRYVAKFMVGHHEYRFSAHMFPYDDLMGAEIAFCMMDNGKCRTDNTGTGNANQIYATVIELIKQVADAANLSRIAYDAADDKRKSLYPTLIKKALPGWELSEHEDDYYYYDKPIKEELNEGISSVLYHYTRLHTAVKILNENRFILTSSIGNRSEEKLMPKGYPYYLSTTRTKMGGYHHTPYNGEVIFNLDGDWYNKRYKGNSVDYWGDRHNDYGRVSEAEDRIFSKTPTIPTTGITSIHVYLTLDKQLQFYTEDVRLLFRLAKTKGIPISLYNDPKAWLLQDPKRVISISSILSSLKTNDKKPKPYRGQSRFQPMKEILELIYKNSTSQLSKNADKLVYNLRYYNDTISGLETDMFNARKPSDSERPFLDNLIKAMRANGWNTTADMGNALKDKWTEIQKKEYEINKKV